jgi:hypothetical protein
MNVLQGVRALTSRQHVSVLRELANFHWFSVVWTLIYHDLSHHMVKMFFTTTTTENS